MSKLHGRRGAWQYQEQLDIRPTALGLFKNILVAEIPPIHINIYLLVVRNQSLSEPPDLTSKDWCLKIIERLHKYDVVDVNIANLKHMALASTATTDNAVGYLPSSSERST